jgi:hypothetical protein
VTDTVLVVLDSNDVELVVYESTSTVLVMSDVLPGPKGDQGDDGLSAYQVAVNNGYVGTEAQWLDSMRDYANLTGVPTEFNPSAHSHPEFLVGVGITQVWAGTQAAYDALGVWSATTAYIIY